MISYLLCISALSAVIEKPIIDHVDTVHEQTVLCSFDGSEMFHQLLFWDIHPLDGCQHIRESIHKPIGFLRGCDARGCFVRLRHGSHVRQVYYRQWMKSRDPFDSEIKDHLRGLKRHELTKPWGPSDGYEGLVEDIESGDIRWLK